MKHSAPEMNASRQEMQIRSALGKARDALSASSPSPRLDAELLLAATMGQSRAWLYANPDAPLNGKQVQVFELLLAERARGRPVAQLTGTREFWSLDFSVDEHTLVPRPETELLVEQALLKLPAEQSMRVLDLGTGSGAIAVAIAHERPACEIIATDLSNAALAVASANAARHCPGRIIFRTGDWYAALAADEQPFDVIVANPPYIATHETGLTDPELAFEPVTALYSGTDGLAALREIAAGAAGWLRPGGWLLLEHGFAQADAVAALLTASGFESVDNVRDLAGQPRVSYGQHSR